MKSASTILCWEQIILARLLAILVPVAIHGIYDSLAFMNNMHTTVALLVFVGIMYIVAVKQVNRYSREDWRAGFYTQSLSDMNFM